MFSAFLTLCILFAGWSFLSVLGNERQRKIQEIEDEQKAQEDAEPPVGDEVAR